MLIKQAEINGTIFDIRLKRGLISQISPLLEAHSDESVFEAYGGALLAGLHDHHIHLNAAAAAMRSVICGPPEVATEQELIEQLHQAYKSARPKQELRGVGYYESVAGDIDCKWLDQFAPNIPIRIQHRTGRLWIFNSLAKRQLDFATPENGRLFDGDIAIRSFGTQSRPDLTPLINKLLSFGITGVTEVTPHNNGEDFEYLSTASQPLKVRMMGNYELPPDLEKNQTIIGQVKLHYHEDNLPALETLTKLIKRAHECGRAIASHCVTHAELLLTLAALEAAGPRHDDRIEHAALTNHEAMEQIKRLGISVVTQPHFIGERAPAYLADVAKRDLPFLWRVGSFLKADIALAAGSDAPFGKFNPWVAMDYACNRPKGLSYDEEITAEQALGLYQKKASNLSQQRRIAIGQPADLCLLTKPWRTVRNQLAQVKIQATFIDGSLVYSTNSSTSPHS